MKLKWVKKLIMFYINYWIINTGNISGKKCISMLKK